MKKPIIPIKTTATIPPRPAPVKPVPSIRKKLGLDTIGKQK